jgi:hypothetical protein
VTLIKISLDENVGSSVPHNCKKLHISIYSRHMGVKFYAIGTNGADFPCQKQHPIEINFARHTVANIFQIAVDCETAPQVFRMVSAIMPASSQKGSVLLSKYQQYKSELNVAGLTFPLTMPNGVRRFEQQNPSISVNTLANKSKVFSIYSIYATPHRDRQHHINLFMLAEGKIKHFIWIRSLSHLLYQPGDHKEYCSYLHEWHYFVRMLTTTT